MDGVELSFDDAALDLIVDKAIEYKLGARGLRSIVETIMIDSMFEIPSSDDQSFTVTREYALEQILKKPTLKPHIQMQNKRSNDKISDIYETIK